MSKYDFKVDLSENTSTGLILKKIGRGSTVLEFGCATGRMTRYMQEHLHCKVYIVEIDPDAYKTASQYAADGVCGDIMNMEWKKKFSDIRFDHILFADVLEHTLNPDLVIREASGLLAPDGNIIFSIPNITHNDIILKAINNHFDYTNIGLLDNTHIHFWGLENIKDFAERNGLHTYNIEATYCETGYTEQYNGELRDTSEILLNILNERLCGTVYQFVITIGLQACENVPRLSSDRNGIVSYIYFDYGQDFSEENKISFRTCVSDNGKYIVHYVINNTKNVRKIRFDPIEFQGCIIQNISVRRDGRQLPCIFSEHIDIENGKLMKGTDPLILIENITGSGPIVIDADLTVLGEAYVHMIENICFTEHRRLDEELKKAESEKAAVISEYSETTQSLENTVSKLNSDNAALTERLNSLIAEKEQADAQLSLYAKKEYELDEALNLYRNTADELKKAIAELERSKAVMEQENIRLKADADMYIRIIDKKEQLLINNERELDALNGQTASQNEQLAALNAQIDSQNVLIAQGNAELCRYRSRKVVRFTDRIAGILRKIKHFFVR